MKNCIHEILSEIHRLLSIATVEDLKRAATLPGTSSNIQLALEALAAEIETTAVWKTSRSSKSPRTPEVPRQVATSESSDPSIAHLIRELERCFEGFSKREIREFSESVGIKLNLREKDGRDRAIARLARALEELSPEARKVTLASFGARTDKQTEGWVSVIRKPN